jgi:hypothetical protein
VPRGLDGSRRTIGSGVVGGLMYEEENDMRRHERADSGCADLFSKPVGQEQHENRDRSTRG